MSINILSNTARVETPFISVTIGDYTFGVFNKEKGEGAYLNYQKYLYPNYVTSLNVIKVNGAINTYTLNLKYQITPGDDPNFLEKVFATQSENRRMILSYGDYSSPTFLYKQEGCTITDIRSNIDVGSSSIAYTITAVSDALSLKAGTYNFPKRTAKPSDIIKELLYKKNYGVQDVFYGMRDPDLVSNKSLIAGDDKQVVIEAKNGITIFDYINYLVQCMSPSSSTNNSIIKNSRYALMVYDDYQGEMGGPYFTIKRMDSNLKNQNSSTTYEIDIGYPNINAVMGFTIDDDQTYSILYNYSQKINQPDYIYRIDDEGNMEQIYSPTISNNNIEYKTTEADKFWWTSVTSFPIKATLTLKGLLRASTLMSYIKINTYFYGKKHLSSGIYYITRQQDSIDSSGYKTILSLTRMQGDEV